MNLLTEKTTLGALQPGDIFDLTDITEFDFRARGKIVRGFLVWMRTESELTDEEKRQTVYRITSNGNDETPAPAAA